MPAPTLPGPDAAAAAAGSRGAGRFWRTVLVFALLNLAAWIVYDRTLGPRRLGLLRVDQFAPGVDATLTEARPTFSVEIQPRRRAPADNTRRPL
jgi:hypothetical protein